jgi:rubredoxin
MSSTGTAASTAGAVSRKWMCANCGYIYEQDKGDPSGGIAPGTAWEDIPDDWRCPDCGASKDDFEMVEM